MRGHLYSKAPGELPAAVLGTDVDVEIDDSQLGKLDGFQAGTPVVIEAVVVAAPGDGMAPASYPAFHVGGVDCGLTAITSPPPERDTTVVRVAVGQRISLRITA